MIVVERLVFDYPTKRALHGVSFQIDAGTITALVGPNGAGKTTVMRCIAGLEQPVSGYVAVNGIEVFREPRRAHQQLGYLSDFFGLYDGLTVRQCLMHAADSHRLGAARRNQRIALVAGQLGIADRLDERAGTLSRGLRQRLAIAQAMVHEPRVLLLDEPAAGLDPEARHELSHVLAALRQAGMTLIVSSHILTELEDYSTDMLIVQGGRVLEHRPIAQAEPEARQVVTLELAQAAPDLAARLDGVLAGLPGAALLDSGANGARLLLPADPAARAALLRRLIEAGLPVATFAAEKQSLQDSYLSRVAAAKHAALPQRGAP